MSEPIGNRILIDALCTYPGAGLTEALRAEQYADPVTSGGFMSVGPPPQPGSAESSVEPARLSAEQREFVKWLRVEVPRFRKEYEFAVKEVLTKVTILREEFLHLHQYNPIEHVTSRVKAPDRLIEKMIRKGVSGGFDAIRERITDIAGVRITCSFIADTYTILDALIGQNDIQALAVKDYIKEPKPNGYRSLHAIIKIPVFLSTGPVGVPVEVQIRTVAMDFWASLEHKIFYKYKGQVPSHVAGDLAQAASVAWQLDTKMEDLHTEVQGLRKENPDFELADPLRLAQALELFRLGPGL
jgi:putative GTP pyrophosphokinase